MAPSANGRTKRIALVTRVPAQIATTPEAYGKSVACQNPPFDACEHAVGHGARRGEIVREPSFRATGRNALMSLVR
jgi:hypothetical protein